MKKKQLSHILLRSSVYLGKYISESRRAHHFRVVVLLFGWLISF